MESNKDEAERCISIALKAIQSNQPERALRFLEKAQRLYPTPRVTGEWEAPQGPKGALAQIGRTRERTDGSSWRRGEGWRGAATPAHCCARVLLGFVVLRCRRPWDASPLGTSRGPGSQTLSSAYGSLWNMSFLGRRRAGRPGEEDSRGSERELLFPEGCSVAQGQWPAWEIL